MGVFRKQGNWWIDYYDHNQQRHRVQVDGSTLSVHVTGAAKPLRKAGQAAKGRGRKPGTPSPGRPAKARGGRAKAASEPAGTASGLILVRVKAGRGWTYQEFPTKQEAEAYLYTLDGSNSAYEVYERKPVSVKKTIQGW